MFFHKKKLALEDKAVEAQLAKINKTSAQASKQATTAIRKVTSTLTEDVAFNFYYATHAKGVKK